MNKTISKIEAYKTKEIEKAISKATQQYEEARGSFCDTGYFRYQKKMDKCEKELNELEDYLHQGESTIRELSTSEYKEYLKMKHDLHNLKSKLFYLIADLELPATADLISAQDILRDYD